jgi:hypothetical protein
MMEAVSSKENIPERLLQYGPDSSCLYLQNIASNNFPNQTLPLLIPFLTK